jgi:hypothetical protein
VEGWRRLHNEELHNLLASPNIISVMKSRRMRWAGHVAHMEKMRNAYSILIGWFENLKEMINFPISIEKCIIVCWLTTTLSPSDCTATRSKLLLFQFACYCFQ